MNRREFIEAYVLARAGAISGEMVAVTETIQADLAFNKLLVLTDDEE
jgi:hypothetical protein